MKIVAGIELLLLSAWAGAAWFSGFIIAPQLFSILPLSQAGNIAGMMFTSVFWLSLPALAFSLYRVSASKGRGSRRIDLLLLTIAFINTALNELVLHPWINAMRVADGPRDAWFGPAHGTSSILFFTNCLVAAVLLVRRVQCTTKT
ncbi:MAG: hypothetical protein DHS20C01_16020 [marine bacterium B5-7]|nr:MAG: hypothetical protein DHS20C01_16020 [marine bacterium B5-7]